jgi:hypothetical protein
MDRIDRKEIGLTLDQRGHLPLGEIQSGVVASNARIGHGQVLAVVSIPFAPPAM